MAPFVPFVPTEALTPFSTGGAMLEALDVTGAITLRFRSKNIRQSNKKIEREKELKAGA